jgi:hypothetical protein
VMMVKLEIMNRAKILLDTSLAIFSDNI